MKGIIGITGHTSGIGKATAAMLEKSGYAVKGFSRSTGHDLSGPDTIPRLLEECADCTAFINNAYYDWAQTDLLFALFERWKGHDRLIINIGSDSGDGIKNFYHPYATKKAALDHGTAQLNGLRLPCRVSTVKPGWVRTAQVEHLKIKEPQLEAERIAEIVLYLLELPKGVHISTLTVQAR